MLLAQCHDREAIEQLLRDVQPPVTRFVRALVGARHAEDVTQEVLVTIYRKFKEGMTLPEVAAVLDVPLGTAKSRMAYGLAALRKQHAIGGNDE